MNASVKPGEGIQGVLEGEGDGQREAMIRHHRGHFVEGCLVLSSGRSGNEKMPKES